MWPVRPLQTSSYDGWGWCRRRSRPRSTRRRGPARRPPRRPRSSRARTRRPRSPRGPRRSPAGRRGPCAARRGGTAARCGRPGPRRRRGSWTWCAGTSMTFLWMHPLNNGGPVSFPRPQCGSAVGAVGVAGGGLVPRRERLPDQGGLAGGVLLDGVLREGLLAGVRAVTRFSAWRQTISRQPRMIAPTPGRRAARRRSRRRSGRSAPPPPGRPGCRGSRAAGCRRCGRACGCCRRRR